MPTRTPSDHVLYFRWAAFQLRLASRGAILAWAAVIASALGMKLLWPAMTILLH